jgi:AcrR family transcriptional regulator
LPVCNAICDQLASALNPFILSEQALEAPKILERRHPMARPKSDDKRRAILEAAMEVFAERGFAHAPTSAISKAAGIAEGTLFTYFSSKDSLIDELYKDLRKEFDKELVDYPFKGDARARLRFMWETWQECNLSGSTSLSNCEHLADC